MDSKRLLIIGTVGALAIGAYLYFRPKKSNLIDTSILEKPSSEISVPPKGTALTSAEEVADTAKKIQDAKGLAKKIADLKIEKNKLISNPKQIEGLSSVLDGTALQSLQVARINKIDQEIADIEKVLNGLGYTELNGNIVKIV